MTAEKVAELIADRVADPVRLAGAVAATARQSRYAEMLPWRPASLSMGEAGIALLCAAMDRHRPGEGWDRAGHAHLAAAVAAATPYDVSLFSGLSGIGFAATQLAAGRPRYDRLLSAVDRAVEPVVARVAGRVAEVDGCAAADHDLVSGLTGTGVYLLARHRITGDSAALATALSALTRLLAGRGHPRRWHTPVELAAGTLRETYPAGHHNCGLAHGVPGPMALLSVAVREGVEVPGAREAIEATAAWLAEHRVGTAAAPDWPDAVALDEPGPPPDTGPPDTGPPDTGAPDTGEPGRAAWCYGAPGVARSLWLAGAALDRPQWRELAARTVRAIAARPPATWSLSTSGFCHGRAGLLQVLRRFAVNLTDPAVTAAAGTLTADLAGEYDPEAILGLRIEEPDGVLVDHPGLLTGAPGVALALLGPAAGTTDWDRMFLLS